MGVELWRHFMAFYRGSRSGATLRDHNDHVDADDDDYPNDDNDDDGDDCDYDDGVDEEGEALIVYHWGCQLWSWHTVENYSNVDDNDAAGSDDEDDASHAQALSLGEIWALDNMPWDSLCREHKTW